MPRPVTPKTLARCEIGAGREPSFEPIEASTKLGVFA
jgi:hypothetical protein